MAAAESNSVTCLQDIEDFALKTLPRNALDYYKSGADHMVTLRENRNAFQRYVFLLPQLFLELFFFKGTN